MLNPKLQASMRVDYYKRFEEFMKMELTQQRELVSSYRKEMQELRNLIKEVMEKCESLAIHNKDEIQSKCGYLESRVQEIDQRVKVNTISLMDINGYIKSIFSTLNEYTEIYSKKSEMDVFIKDNYSMVKSQMDNHSSCLDLSNKRVEETICVLIDKIDSLKEELTCKCKNLGSDLNEKLSIYQMDKDSVLAEIRRYRKDSFIMQKKIENLYTQIDRINKRSEECRKQD